MEWIVLVVLILVWRSHASRLKKLEQERNFQEQVIRELTRRVYALESEPRAARPVEAAIPAPVTAPATAPPPSEPEPEQGWDETVEEPLVPALRPPAAPPPPVPAGPPPPSLWDRVVKPLRGQDWEAIVGGSWLNAAGVLLLVIGLSLLVGFGVTQFGPAGKIGIGVAASVAMLASGAWIERRDRYRIIGRGLLAGGWAALYFTAYASHAIPQAQVIASPLAGGLALLAVACGMIGHSLRYRSQRLTLLAFFSAFVALQLQPLSALGLAATIPLAIALLTISRKLNWTMAPMAGMLLTYWTFAFRFDATQSSPLLGVASLYAYWIAFEAYDLLRLREQGARTWVDHALFPLNALLLLGAAFLTLPPSSPLESSRFLASFGVLMMTSAAIRRQWKPGPADVHPLANLPEITYSLGVVLAASLFAGALMKRFAPIRAEVGLLLEGQLFILASMRWSDSLFRRTGQGVFGVALGHLLLVGTGTDGWRDGESVIGYWVAVAFGMAATFYVNRWLLRDGPELTWPAAGLLLLGSAGLLRNAWAVAAWMAIAVVLLEVYRRTGLREFRHQAVAAGGLATLFGGVLSYERNAREHWEYAAVNGVSGALAYFAGWRSRSLTAPATIAGSLLAGWAAWLSLPAPLVSVAWGLLGLTLFETGVRNRWLRWQGHVFVFAAFARTLIANFPAYGQTAGVSHRLLTVLPLVVLAWHLWLRTRGLSLSGREALAARSYSFAGVALLAALFRFELGRTATVAGWAAMMVTLLYLGRRFDVRDLRLQSYALAAATFLRSWSTNFASPDGEPGFVSSILMGVLVAAAYHICEFLTPRQAARQRWGFALAGVALLALLLFYETSGRMITLAWGAQAAATLAAGFPLRERSLRLAGLGLFGVCVLKLFFYDLRNLDTMARILSFIVMGLVFISASWAYMRFREKIQRYL